MSVIQGTANQASTRGFYNFPLEQSLRFNDNDSAYLSWTPSTTPTSDKKFTFSFWMKLGNIGTDFHVVKHNEASNVNQIDIHKQSNNTLNIVFRKTGTSTKSAQLVTNQVFRDPSAWYHIVVSFDSTAGTPFCYLYVNGSQVTSLSTNTQPSANDQVPIFASGKTFDIGRDQFDTDEYMDGYLAEVNFIDGTALDADSFGELKNGVWIPKDPSGLTYGTNGFRLSFADDAEVEAFNTVLYRGNGGTQSVTGYGFEPDVVWIKERSSTSGHVIFDQVRGATKSLFPDNTGAESTTSTQLTSFDSDGFTTGSSGGTNENGQTYVAWGWKAGDGPSTADSDVLPIYNTNADGSSVTSGLRTDSNASYLELCIAGYDTIVDSVPSGRTSSAVTLTKVGDTTLGQEFNLYGQAIYFDDTGDELTGTLGTAIGTADFTLEYWVKHNAFEDYDTHFSTTRGSGGFNVGTDASRDFVMFSNSARQIEVVGAFNLGQWHHVAIVRSSGTTKGYLDGKEMGSWSDSQNYSATAFSIGDLQHTTGEYTNGYMQDIRLYRGLAKYTSEFSVLNYAYLNDDGSIESRVKANTTYGFSIVSYTGTGTAGDSFGHGLSSTPDMIFIKDRSAANSWTVWHSAIMTNAGYLVLDGTQAANTTDTGYWNATAPSSSVVTLGTRARVNTNTNDYIAYCWAEKAGYSKFDSFAGEGANNTTISKRIYTTNDGTASGTGGFRPSLIIFKRTDSASVNGWYMFDSTRDTDSVVGLPLYPSENYAEGGTESVIEFNDDGFTIVRAYQDYCGAGGTYIYAAFADTREAAFWLDQSGNDNDWQPVNLDHNDTVADSPTDNFCTMNPLDKGSTITLSDGNLRVSSDAGSDDSVRGTMALGEGQYYFEFTLESFGGGVQPFHWGIAKSNASLTTWPSGGDYVVMEDDGALKVDGGSVSYYSGGFAAGDVIGVAVDVTNDSITFTKNGTSLGAYSYTIEAGEYLPYVGDGSGSRYGVTVANFGQQPFKYDPPA